MTKQKIQVPVIRKASDERDWQKMANEGSYKNSYFQIERVITISETDFDKLSYDFYENQKFIKENNDCMWFSNNENCHHGIAVICKSKNIAILIDSQGFAYARYTAIIEKSKIKIPKTQKPKVEFDSRGASGNIYYILGLCSKALRKQQRIIDYNKLRDEVFESNSYNEALAKIRKVIDLVDISKENGE